MLIEIFKTGTHTDSAGNTRTWTDDDLDAIAAKYNPANHEAPVVIGHPKDNAPAFGWVEGLERKGSVLYAKLKDLIPEFVEAVKKGLYKKRSISLYPDMTLRHVGFLGAMPPAVKGLADVAFSDAGAVTIEFEDYRVSTIGNIFQRLREWLIEKFGAEVADKVVRNWEIEELKREIKEPEAMPAAFNEGGLDMEKIKELEAKLEEERKSRIAAEQKFSEKENEAVALRQEIEKERAEKRQAELQSFCEGLMKEGRLIPAMKPAVMDFMEILHSTGEYEFAEGDGKVKAQPVERFKAFLNGLPKQVEFSETATKEKAKEGKGASYDFSGQVDKERLEIHQKAMDFAEKEHISYRDALIKVLKEE